MCRLFGFRSVLQSKVHKSLISAENAFVLQSEEHPDGWGVCHYVEGVPQLIRSISTAVDDQLFAQVSGVVTSQTVVAHLRKSTQGELSILNTHPFQYGKWIFAHNGNIKNFESIKSKIVDQIDEKFKKFILGKTDSEMIFYFVLTHLSKYISLRDHQTDWNNFVKGIKEAIASLIEIIGPVHPHDDGNSTETFLTFLITDGQIMLGYQGGKRLFYSTHKSKCSDREDCPFLNKTCENPTSSGAVNHLILSSEPLSGENIWNPLDVHQIVGVDHNFNIHFDQMK